MTKQSFVNLFHRRWREAEKATGPLDVVLYEGNPSEFPHKRNMAYTVIYRGSNGSVHTDVVVAPKLIKGEQDRADAVIRHELGHVIDAHFPFRKLREWAPGKLPRGLERRADVIAEVVWGEPIKYDRDTVQSICCGVHPRPPHLGY